MNKLDINFLREDLVRITPTTFQTGYFFDDTIIKNVDSTLLYGGGPPIWVQALCFASVLACFMGALAVVWGVVLALIPL